MDRELLLTPFPVPVGFSSSSKARRSRPNATRQTRKPSEGKPPKRGLLDGPRARGGAGRSSLMRWCSPRTTKANPPRRAADASDD